MSEYLVSAKVIEFFWLLQYFLLFLLATIIKFFVKKEIHKDERRSSIYNQQRQDTQQQMHPHSLDPEADKINVVANPIHVDIQVKNSISADLNEKVSAFENFQIDKKRENIRCGEQSKQLFASLGDSYTLREQFRFIYFCNGCLDFVYRVNNFVCGDVDLIEYAKKYWSYPKIQQPSLDYSSIYQLLSKWL